MNRTMKEVTDSFKPSTSFYSGSSSIKSAVESAKLKQVEKQLLKRKVAHYDKDT